MTETILFDIWILIIGICLGFGAWSLVLIPFRDEKDLRPIRYSLTKR
jgi:hypothetical protein